MPIAGLWRWRELSEQLSKSETGCELLTEAEKTYSFEVLRFDIWGKSAGHHDYKNKVIATNGWDSLDEATATLGHELEHYRQHRDGEYLLPSECSERGFIEQTLRNEQKAESTANQICWELHQQGISGPMEAQLNGPYQSQASVYFDARAAGRSHIEAARVSEPRWFDSGAEQPYSIKASGDYHNYLAGHDHQEGRSSDANDDAAFKRDAELGLAHDVEADRSEAIVPPPSTALDDNTLLSPEEVVESQQAHEDDIERAPSAVEEDPDRLPEQTPPDAGSDLETAVVNDTASRADAEIVPVEMPSQEGDETAATPEVATSPAPLDEDAVVDHGDGAPAVEVVAEPLDRAQESPPPEAEAPTPEVTEAEAPVVPTLDATAEHPEQDTDAPDHAVATPEVTRDADLDQADALATDALPAETEASPAQAEEPAGENERRDHSARDDAEAQQVSAGDAELTSPSEEMAPHHGDKAEVADTSAGQVRGEESATRNAAPAPPIQPDETAEGESASAAKWASTSQDKAADSVSRDQDGAASATSEENSDQSSREAILAELAERAPPRPTDREDARAEKLNELRAREQGGASETSPGGNSERDAVLRDLAERAPPPPPPPQDAEASTKGLSR